MRTTFYGHFSGYSSYPTVCRAIARTLHAMGKDVALCDLRPAQEYEELEHIETVSGMEHADIQVRARMSIPYAGSIREGVGLTFGFPEWTRHVPRHQKNIGYHVCDLDEIPPSWVEDMNRMDRVLTPSRWCQSVFRRCGVTAPVTVVPHGVSDTGAASLLGGEELRFVHFCSSRVPDRKGTLELVQAFTSTVLDAKLVLVTDSPYVFSRVECLGDDRIIAVSQAPVGVCDQAERYRSASFVVQPSRAEGFGLIPLEALAAGVPVVATCCTGHSMYARDGLPGMLDIPTGDLAFCPPGPGIAPSVDVEDIRRCLLYAGDNYDTLRKAAQENRAALLAQWSWERVLQPLAEMIG